MLLAASLYLARMENSSLDPCQKRRLTEVPPDLNTGTQLGLESGYVILEEFYSSFFVGSHYFTHPDPIVSLSW